jgi:hypothetical protein
VENEATSYSEHIAQFQVTVITNQRALVTLPTYVTTGYPEPLTKRYKIRRMYSAGRDRNGDSKATYYYAKPTLNVTPQPMTTSLVRTVENSISQFLSERLDSPIPHSFFSLRTIGYTH